jgi:SAM-dependent methyltransferase
MAEKMTIKMWDGQYTRQAGWTRPTRTHLYRRANLLRAQDVLDVGSGTGAVTEELAARTQGVVTGVDIDPAVVAFAQQRGGRATYQHGDAHQLPFDDASFDRTVCHLLLMWCHDPAMAAREMVRVTRPGGWVLVCAEPDYGGRVDYPELPIAHWQIQALREEGADPCLGRKLRALLALPAVRRLEVGLIPGLWDPATLRVEFEAEWALWQRSFQSLVSAAEIERIRTADRLAIEFGTRLAYLPVFYALAHL